MRLPTLLLCVTLSGPVGLCAQSLTNLPPSGPNQRFFSDRFVARRPSLSLNGFSCDADRACADGLGLAESLTLAYGGDPRKEALLAAMLEWASEPIARNPPDRAVVIDNTKRLQAGGLTALAGLVTEENGWVRGRPLGYSGPLTRLPEASGFLGNLRQVIHDPTLVLSNRQMSDDAIKWTMALTNLARTLDLYLALENAVDYYGRTDVPLLTCSEKLGLLNVLGEAATRVDDLGNLPVFAGIKRDEIQAGNWPMKTHVAVAYAALGSQSAPPSACGEPDRHSWEHWVERGLRSAGAPTSRNRSKHWHYQTGSGQAFFAEGPYYLHLALGELLPFWHTVRINRMLSFHPDFDVDDPFRAAWFLEPLRWLLDLAAPDATTPPLDDGNREPMYRAGMMAWGDAYGDSEIGARSEWLRRMAEGGLDSDLLPNEFALPGAPAIMPHGEGLMPVGPPGRPQQLVVNHQTASGQRHYVLLNGESGDAIGRGEGHEQADQLQLLYYVDNRSLLIDSGYDDAVGVANSTWNHYYDHNVLSVVETRNGEGGLEPPRPNLFSTRIGADHPDVLDLSAVTHGGVIRLRGDVRLYSDDGETGPLARYRREVLVVRDPDRPYLIDLNLGTPLKDSVAFLMRYHGGTEHVTQRGPVLEWEDGGLRLEVLLPDQGTVATAIDTARERQGSNTTIRTAMIRTPAAAADLPVPVLAVLSDASRPLPRFGGTNGAWTAWAGSSVDVILRGEEATLELGDHLVTVQRDPDAGFGFLRLHRAPEGWEPDEFFASGARLDVSTERTRTVEPPSGTLRLYPNPSTGVFLVDGPRESVAGIEVYDLLGRRLQAFGDVAAFERVSWRPGGYLVRVALRTGRNIVLRGLVVSR